MALIDFIFENQNVQALITENEELLDISTASLIQYNTFLESFIYSNLDDYISDGELIDSYSNIVNMVIIENINFIQVCSDIIRSNSDLNIKKEILESFMDPEIYTSYILESSIIDKGSNILSGLTQQALHSVRGVVHNGVLGKTSNPEWKTNRAKLTDWMRKQLGYSYFERDKDTGRILRVVRGTKFKPMGS